MIKWVDNRVRNGRCSLYLLVKSANTRGTYIHVPSDWLLASSTRTRGRIGNDHGTLTNENINALARMGRQDHPMYHNSSSLDSDGEIDYQNMSAQEYEQRKNAQMSDQDNVLDQIHTGVKGLKNHANAINGEVVEQNAIIDDLGNVSRLLLRVKPYLADEL